MTLPWLKYCNCSVVMRDQVMPNYAVSILSPDAFSSYRERQDAAVVIIKDCTPQAKPPRQATNHHSPATRATDWIVQRCRSPTLSIQRDSVHASIIPLNSAVRSITIDVFSLSSIAGPALERAYITPWTDALPPETRSHWS